MKDIVPYSSDEIIKEKDGFPSRGIYCPKCRVNIPIFADLSREDEVDIRLEGRGDPIKIIRLVREKTGCGVRWAKIWTLHPDGPNEAGFHGESLCRYCGGKLRSEEAKQCPHCLISWHDSNNVRKL